MSGRISDHIRSNIWGIVACFILLTGTAVAAGGSGDGPQATKSASVTTKIKKLKRRVAALEASQGAARPPTGPAGGDLTGSYPNPLIGPNAVGTAEVDGTLTGSDIASDALTGADIDEAMLGTSIFGLPVTVSGLTFDVSFPGCGGTNRVVRITATTDTENSDVAMRMVDSLQTGGQASADLIVDNDFDTADFASVDTAIYTSPAVPNGHVTVEYRRPLGFVSDRVSVELFFRASGCSSLDAVFGRAIG